MSSVNRNIYLANTEIGTEQRMQEEKEKAISGFVVAYNAANVNAPFRFKSAADYLAYKKAKTKRYCNSC